MSNMEAQSVNDKQVIADLISYLTSQNIIGITYAEALDMYTVAHLNIYITNTLTNTEQQIPAKRVSLMDCDDAMKRILKNVLLLLSQQNSVGFNYHFAIPDSPMELDLCVRMTQVSTDMSDGCWDKSFAEESLSND